MESTFVSIIIPTYNRCATLVEAVSSILKQTFKNWEIIIIDDGSSDDTRVIVQGLNNARIKYLFLENSGPSNARNRGVKIATGQYLTFLDSDDLLQERYLEFFCEAIINNNYPELIFCSVDFINSHGELFFKDYPKKFLSFKSQALMLSGAFLVKKEFFTSVGGYDPKIKFGENFELGIRFLMRMDAIESKLVIIDKYLLNVRRQSNDHLSGNHLNKALSTVYVIGKHYDFLRKENRKFLGTFYEVVSYNYFKAGCIKESFHWIFKTIRNYPLRIKPYLRLLAYSFFYSINSTKR